EARNHRCFKPFDFPTDVVADWLLVERVGASVLEFVEHGYSVEICSPEGGKLEGDKWSDPRDESGYSAHDLLSLGFISSPEHMKFVQNSRPLSSVNVEDLDAVLFVGGQGPMYTFYNDERVHKLCASCYEAGKVTGVICHATCILLKARTSNGKL